jgi:hypothetical protein
MVKCPYHLFWANLEINSPIDDSQMATIRRVLSTDSLTIHSQSGNSLEFVSYQLIDLEAMVAVLHSILGKPLEFVLTCEVFYRENYGNDDPQRYTYKD